MLTSSSTAAACCQQLYSQLGSQVSFPASATYTSIKESYWSIQESSLSPSCIVRPNNAQDVAKVISTISGIQGCPFAIKGNTHAPVGGFANIQDGITIDMTGLSTFSLNKDKTVLSAGGGANWLSIYAFLDPYDLIVAGGRNGLVGIGGLTLGGGISHYAARQGFACDNVVNFEVVTASGAITNANATHSPDLFRSLKGGGNNFGIVTRFDLKTFAQGELHVAKTNNAIKYTAQVAKAFTDITNAPVFDPYTSLVTSFDFVPATKSWSIGNSAVYTKPVASPAVFKELLAVPSISNSSTFERPYVYANESNTPPLNWFFYTGTFGVSADLMTEFISIVNSSIYDFDTGSGLSLWGLTFEPLPTAITRIGDEKGGNSLGLHGDQGNEFITLWGPLWSDSSRSDAITALAREVGQKMNDAARKRGLLHQWQYLNYADSSQQPIQSYGVENVVRLKAASDRYDPHGVFQKQVPGGFKLPAW